MNTWFLVSHRDGSDHGPEYQPRRRLVLFRRSRPTEPPTATRPPSMRIASGQSMLTDLFGGA